MHTHTHTHTHIKSSKKCYNLREKNKKQGTVLDFALICDIFYLGKVQSYGAVLLFRVHACMCVYVCVTERSALMEQVEYFLQNVTSPLLENIINLLDT